MGYVGSLVSASPPFMVEDPWFSLHDEFYPKAHIYGRNSRETTVYERIGKDMAGDFPMEDHAEIPLLTRDGKQSR
ncbi:MAG: hypothetical protein Ct9H90mP5_11680 [Acidimicrobiaceae bacterium]|nr:MAG: hypothetical protein Ct9H90mP5_11680 [Acidimicrobiaceae bacterium]